MWYWNTKRILSEVESYVGSFQSVIIPVHNGEKWIDQCFKAITNQTAIQTLKFEICVCDDASTDRTRPLLDKWKSALADKHIDMKIYDNVSGRPGGVGYSRNRAISISSGEYLCFQDVDDVMLPDRIASQYWAARQLPDDVLLGSRFERAPAGSTHRYTRWANGLTPDQLRWQVCTAHGPTLIMPTWFCHGNVFRRVGGFSERGAGTPEDLVFFYAHLRAGGRLARVDQVLLVYSYHTAAATWTIREDTIWDLRLEHLERTWLVGWAHFTIWNSGRQGRRLYRGLSPRSRDKVAAMCDIDPSKVGRRYVPFDPATRTAGAPVDIVHFSCARPPFVICVKQDMTDGAFERNLNSLNLRENKDYVFFS